MSDRAKNNSSLSPIQMSDLPELVRDALKNTGWTELTPVQSEAIPYMMAKRDVMVQARTGSGKTAAFVMPIINQIDPLDNACQALILVPTRELAIQVEKEANIISQGTGIRTVPVYGGVKYKGQLKAFREGAHVIVGTPGRILDHLLNNNLKLDGIHTLVFDEADRMLSMGFYPDMKQVQRFLPERRIHSCMFSATFPPHVRRLADEFLHEPDFINLSSDSMTVEDVEHISYTVPVMEKDRVLVRIIELENPASAIIFCNTRQRVNYVSIVLQRFGYDADQISSDLSQNKREEVLQRVRDNSLRFLVATDVAARGIDIPDLSHVIQYEPPEDPEQYIHRAGRTGRAGASGIAITLVEGMEELKLMKIAKQFKVDIEQRPVPTEAEVADVLAKRLRTLLHSKRRNRDKLRAERMQRFIGMARDLANEEDEDGLEVLAMLLDDYYQETIHNPPELPEMPVERSKSSSGRGKKRGRGRGRR